MKTYENNMADQALIVKSIKVLENIEGGGITEIRNNIDAMRKQQSFQGKTQEEYWTALSSDGIVSPVEKQSLLREMENIKRSEAAILSQAATYGYTGLVLQDYIATYNDLRDYLYVTLKLFEDMTKETVIDDRDTFNTKFSQYYYSENFVLLAITAGILDTINIRVLQSLNESGTEGEIAIYRGAVYQFQNDVWKNVTTGAYKGPCTELPESEDGAFFIVSESFTMTDVLYVNDEEFYVNGDALEITRTFIKGMIYYCIDGIWYIEENTKDWKYTAAFADVINITGELPALFQAALDELQAGIDDLQSQIGQINTHVPVYLGASSSIPTGQEGDFFVYSGESTGDWIKSKVYKYTNGSWGTALDPRDTANRHYYMMALEDILAMNVTGDGYFSTIFALAFFANDATLQSLSVRTIYLSSYGTIQSDLNTYSQEQTGLRIDAAGNIDANQNTHLKGKVAIGVPLNGNTDFSYYDVVIGGNTKISGNINALSGTISEDCNIYGKIRNHGVPFCLLGAVNFGYNATDKILTRISSQNVASVTRVEQGVYQVDFSNPVWLKTHSNSGHKYIDVITVGNAADSFDSGFINHLLVNPNWLRNYVDGRLQISGDYALVSYVVLYFINTFHVLVDPKSAQILLMGVETTL